MDLSRSIKLALIFLSTIVQCVNLNTVPINDNRSSMKVYSYNKSVQTAQLVMLKPFKCYYRFTSCRSNNLLQWKRRRRMFIDMIKLPEKTDYKLRHERDIEGDNSMFSLNLELNNNSREWVHGIRYSSPVGFSLIARFKQQWPVAQWKQYRLYSDEYLTLINPHWLRFAPPAPAVNYALGALYVLMMLVGCTGNALVLFMYFKLVILCKYVPKCSDVK